MGKIRVISWNIAGIRGLEKDAWKYLRGFDVICLQETWLEDRDGKYWNKRLEGYEIRKRDATKGGERGRVKGGMVMAVRKKEKTEKVEWLEERIKEFIGARIKIKGERWWIGTTYMREERRNNYRELEEMVDKARGEKILWCGDMNARTG